MTASAKLTTAAHVAFVPIGDKDQALAFYQDKLGLTLLMDQSPFALVFSLDSEADGTTLRATFAAGFLRATLGWLWPFKSLPFGS